MLLRNRLIVVAFFASVALLASYSPLAFFKRRIASVQLVFAVCSASPKLLSAPASFRGDACFAVSVGSGTPALLASSSADLSAAVVSTTSVAFAIAFAPVVAASFSAAVAAMCLSLASSTRFVSWLSFVSISASGIASVVVRVHSGAKLR